MKKLYTLLTMAAAATLTLSAQQLPNSGFEESWGDCTPWTSAGNTKTKGTQPASWKISHVIGVSGTGATEVGSKEAGYNSTNSVKLVNTPNPYKKSQIVPAYLTLGTPWATSKGGMFSDPTNKDGGTFGGIDFAYRPDAVTFRYKRSHGTANTTEKAMVVAYSWKGSTTQASVPGENKLTGTLKTVDMVDRDRNILDMTTSEGGAVTKSSDFELIAKISYDINGDQADWTSLTIPFEYNSTNTPAKFNIAFCAADYFSTSPGNGNTMFVDDVKLIYYSRLASLSVNGTAVAGFSSDTYSYTIDSEMPSESAFAFTTMGNSGSGRAVLSLDTENAKATITVTNVNAGGTDADGATSHVYTLQFNKKQIVEPLPDPAGDTVKYPGSLVITMGESVLNSDATIEITPMSDGNYRMVLPNFSLDLGDGPVLLGDIVVYGVTRTGNNPYTYAGSADGITLAEGTITANVVIEGTETDGVLHMLIHVNWIDPDSGETIAPIEVEFTQKTAAAEGLKYDGTLDIVMYPGTDDAAAMDPQTVSVYIADEDGGTKLVTLPDFSLDLGDGPVSLGDIVVTGVTATTAGGVTSYTGSVYHMSLYEGNITANVELTGTLEGDRLSMIINVNWVDPDSDEVIAPIQVTFNGNRDLSGIDSVTADNTDAPVIYYNLQGHRVAADNLTPGIYVRRQGTEVSKILVK